MNLSNKAAGSAFERELAQMLFNKGYWVHLLTQNRAGQPADLIAAKNGRTYLIDCKNCTQNEFDLTRIEENQRTAMEMWKMRGNGVGWFALKTKYGIYMLSLDEAITLREWRSSLSEGLIRETGTPFGRWMK